MTSSGGWDRKVDVCVHVAQPWHDRVKGGDRSTSPVLSRACRLCCMWYTPVMLVSGAFRLVAELEAYSFRNLTTRQRASANTWMQNQRLQSGYTAVVLHALSEESLVYSTAVAGPHRHVGLLFCVVSSVEGVNSAVRSIHACTRCARTQQQYAVGASDQHQICLRSCVSQQMPLGHSVLLHLQDSRSLVIASGLRGLILNPCIQQERSLRRLMSFPLLTNLGCFADRS